MQTTHIDGFVAPKVSVIIPFFNEKSWLEEAIESVLNQTYQNIEVIVVNDGSKEDISDLELKYKKVMFLTQSNMGAAGARNNGIRHANGDYIAFLDSDDIWLPEKTEKQIRLMLDTNAAWSHTSYQKFGAGEDSVYLINKFCGEVFPRILCSATIGTPCVMIKRDVLLSDETLRFKEDMRNGQDYYLWILLSQKYPLYGIQDVLVKVRQRGTNTAKKVRSQLIVKGLIYKYIIAKHHVEISTPVRLSYQFCSATGNIVSRISNPKLSELMARFFYLLPYVVFKSSARRNSEQSESNYIRSYT